MKKTKRSASVAEIQSKLRKAQREIQTLQEHLQVAEETLGTIFVLTTLRSEVGIGPNDTKDMFLAVMKTLKAIGALK